MTVFFLVCHDFGHTTETPPGCFTGHFDELVMCHLDIHLRNLILDGQRKLWLLDWAFAGAYPPYFETANLTWKARGPLQPDYWNRWDAKAIEKKFTSFWPLPLR